MKKRLLILMTGLAAMTAPAHAQFNTVAQLSNLYKVEVVKTAAGDDTACLTADLSTIQVEQPIQTAAYDDAYKKEWTDRFLSVSYPLRHIKINSSFGYRSDPFTGKRRYHNGIDLHARGDEVFAMMDGVVIKAGQDNVSGKYVILRHGNYTVSYCHLSRTTAAKGTAVKAGTVVGITGSTGRSTGEHLHITCKLGGKNIDPLLLLDFIKATREECVAALVKAM
ncbi:MAG: M23 family metallopeptidase [Alistipes sp.]|nr:M23 family metallopeptidase [Alistipes sp.]